MEPHLCQVWVFGLLLQKINKAHAKLHHKVSELRLKSLVELVGVPPNQLVHGLSHPVQTWLRSVGVTPSLLKNKPVDSFEVLPKLQPARLQSFGLLTKRNVICVTNFDKYINAILSEIKERLPQPSLPPAGPSQDKIHTCKLELKVTEA